MHFNTQHFFTVEPESDFLTWKTRISEVEMEAQKVMKRFMDKCAAYPASIVPKCSSKLYAHYVLKIYNEL